MSSDEFVNIASHLPERARFDPNNPAVIAPCGYDRNGRFAYNFYTLKQLDEQSDIIAYGLEYHGILRGTRVVLMATPGLDFFALTFALFKIGAVPVMVDPGIGIKGLGICLAQAEPEVFIGIPKAQAARLIFGWAKNTVKKSITVGRFPFTLSLDDVRKAGKSGVPYPVARTTSGETAAILFTSGSTGISKGAVYTHGIFDAQVQALKEVYGIQPGEKDLATFPLFALFGPALGMAAVIPDMDASRPASADPVKIFQTIEDFGPTNMFASPALINKLGRYGEKHGIKLPSLKRVISAGAPARPDALERFSKMLSPGVEIFTPYGATESLPVCNIGSSEILSTSRKMTDEGKGVCIGYPNPGITAKVIRITEEPIPEWSDDLVVPAGEIGEFVVSGPVVTEQYYNMPEATKLSKIYDCGKKILYHRMGDVGYMDESGKLWFCGRKSHRVVVGEKTYFTIPCEAVFNTHPQVYRTALVGPSINGKVTPVLCVELEDTANISAEPTQKGQVDKEQILQELRQIGSTKKHTKDITRFLFHPSFPVDIRHNAKIFREKLTVWAEKQVRQ